MPFQHLRPSFHVPVSKLHSEIPTTSLESGQLPSNSRPATDFSGSAQSARLALPRTRPMPAPSPLPHGAPATRESPPTPHKLRGSESTPIPSISRAPRNFKPEFLHRGRQFRRCRTASPLTPLKAVRRRPSDHAPLPTPPPRAPARTPSVPSPRLRPPPRRPARGARRDTGRQRRIRLDWRLPPAVRRARNPPRRTVLPVPSGHESCGRGCYETREKPWRPFRPLAGCGIRGWQALPVNKRAEFRSLPARTSQRRASSRRNSSGVIQQPPLAHDGRRQRSGHVLGARIEVSRRPANHVRGRPNPPKRSGDAWPIWTLRRIVRKDRAKI